MKVGSVVIDCDDFQAMLGFWQAALRYEPQEPVEEGWVILRDPDGAGVNISLNGVGLKRTGRNWLHLDLYTDDQATEVERLLGLGAALHPREAEPDDDFVVLADPDGNLFCVVDTKHDGSSAPV
jgi:hypothetical protein